MAVTDEQRYTAYDTVIAGNKEIETLADLTLEYYSLHYPLLEYRVLDHDETIIDDFYGTSKRADRVYKVHKLPMNPNVSPEEMGLTAFSIDVTRTIVFHAAAAAFNRLNCTPKEGDVILFDGDLYEVNVARRLKESRVAKTNAYLELEFLTTIAQKDFQ